MWKAILAVILGYLTMFVWVTVTLLATVAIDLAGLHLVTDEPADGQPAAEATAASEGTESDDMMAAMKAMGETTSPAWYNFALPFIGSAGVLLGGRLKRKRAAASAGEAPVIT